MDAPVGTSNITFAAADHMAVAEYRDLFSIQVNSTHGTSDPANGSHPVFRDCVLTNSVDGTIVLGSTQFVCTGWTMTGNEPAIGSTNLFVMTSTNNAALIWKWATNYWVATATNGNGKVDVGSGWYGIDSNVLITATAASYYHFVTWTGSVITTQNPYPLTVNRPEDITALFDANRALHGTPEWWLAKHGWISNFDVAETNDVDGDGMRAWEEFVADTDPTNKNSVLSIVGLSLEEDRVKVEWRGGQAATQFLQYCTDLGVTGDAWITIFTNLPPTTAVTNIVDVWRTNHMLFYRIKAAQ